MSKGKFDNIETINNLTHDDAGKVNVKLFNQLIDEFNKYIVFRNIIKKKHVKVLELDGDMIFKIKFPNKKLRQAFIDEYDGKTIEQYHINITNESNKVFIKFS